jgi:hypothetical protein
MIEATIVYVQMYIHDVNVSSREELRLAAGLPAIYK